MENTWENIGDVSPEHGQVWVKEIGGDYADCVTVRPWSDYEAGATDNFWLIERGTIDFCEGDWDSALACSAEHGTDWQGPPELHELICAFYYYSGLNPDAYFGSWHIVQIGKRDWSGEPAEIGNPHNFADAVLHGNASIEKYLATEFLN